MKEKKHIKKSLSKIKILEFINPAEFLQTLYNLTKAAQKEQKLDYSYRHFAQDLGFGFTNYLHLICSGKRYLTVKSGKIIGENLKLKSQEQKYLTASIELMKAKSTEKAEDALSSLFLIKQKSLEKNADHTSGDLMEYLGKWYIPVIRELVGVKGFREDPFWIASRITPKVRAREIKNAMILLEKLGYLVRNADGDLQQAEKNIQTSAMVRNLSIKKYHTEFLDLSRKALQNESLKENDFQALTLPVDENLAREIRHELHSLLGKLLAKSTHLKNPGEIVQLNTQLFSLTKTSDDMFE